VNRDIPGGIDADANLLPVDADYGHGDIGTDRDRFTDSARENENWSFLAVVSLRE
jgi:hypothetical protein